MRAMEPATDSPSNARIQLKAHFQRYPARAARRQHIGVRPTGRWHPSVAAGKPRPAARQRDDGAAHLLQGRPEHNAASNNAARPIQPKQAAHRAANRKAPRLAPGPNL